MAWSAIPVVLFPFFFVVAVALVFPSRTRRIRRAMAQATRRTIAAFGDGEEARIAGIVRPGDCLTAPLSGRRCVYHELVLLEEDSDGDTTLLETSQGLPFVLEDGTGRALIDPAGAQVAIAQAEHAREGRLDVSIPSHEQLLLLHGLASARDKPLRFRERVIPPGARIAVLGRALREPDPDGAALAQGYRLGPPTRLRLGGSAAHPLLVSDDAGEAARAEA